VSTPAGRLGHPLVRGARLLLVGLLLLLGGCKVELYGNLSESSANEMLAILLQHGIPSEKVPAEEGLMAIHVEEDRFAEAVELLKRYGQPREQFDSIGQIFAKQGLISSPLEERVRFVYALGQSLSETISQIDGVLSSRVHVVLPNSELSLDSVVPSSAAVFIRHRADAPVDRLVPQIKMLVTNSIEGLSYDKVSVVLFPVEGGGELSQPPVEVAGLLLHPDTVGRFWLIAGGLGLVAVLALAGNAVMFWLWRRRSSGDAAQVANAG
jgi:type III secretion protein J